MTACPAQTGPVWKLGGEPCGCSLPQGHEGDHECSCGSWWVDAVRRDTRPAPPTTCPECGHYPMPEGCTGPSTASDAWAGVSPASCDCPCSTRSEEKP